MKNTELASELKKVSLRVEALELKIQLLETPVVTKTETHAETRVVDTKEERIEYPIPREYREIIDSVLNKNFKVFLDYSDGNTDFNLIVPDKYSALTPESKKISGGFDRRRRVIPPYEGINGVREYVGMVWKSFNPAIKAQIVADRSSDVS